MGDQKIPLTWVRPTVVAFVLALACSTQTATASRAQEAVSRPVISEEIAPLELITPIARDGHRGQGILRKPPGQGPFPVVVLIHGGLVTRSTETLRQYVLTAALPSRFLAAGYVIAAITYRSRDDDPQSRVSVEDCLAAINHLRRLSYVDAASLMIYGSSGGGDLALELATVTDLAAIVPEEPASVLFTGVFNTTFPKAGSRYTSVDAEPIGADPKRYYVSTYQKLTREKIARIRSPILIVQGDQHWINRFNAEVLIPELRSARKPLDVLTYPGAPHGFAFGGVLRPIEALKAFQDVHAFFQRHVRIKPNPLDPSVVKQVPLPPPSP